MRFVDRQDELTTLEERWSSPRGEYMVILGRRRVGKTALILRFAREKRCVYFEATTGTESDHLEDVSRLLAELTGRELFAAQPLTSWGAFFAAIAEELEAGPLVVVLDEFQFIARQSRDVGSQINRFWRVHQSNPNLFLVLSGSDVSFFEREVVGYAATTYGRRTGSLRLLPFPYTELRHVLGTWTKPDLVRAWAVFGGMPYYLEAVDAKASLEENIARAVLAPGGLLREEPRFLFGQHTDLRDDAVYFSILRALAAGRTRRNEIADRIQRSGDATGQLLDRLIEMGLVRRVHPVTVANPDRTRQVRFAIEDPFLRFWFRFVHPFEGRLQNRADARRHAKRRVMPELDRFVSEAPFEQVCQAWLRRHLDAAAVGWWWGNVKEATPDGPRTVRRELDAVAVDDDGSVIAVGSCKWTRDPLPATEEALALQLAPHAGPARTPPEIYLFSLGGFEPALVQRAAGHPGLHLVDVDGLF